MNITALSDWLQPWCRKWTCVSLIAYERIDPLMPHIPKGSRDNSKRMLGFNPNDCWLLSLGILLRAKLPEFDNWQHELSDEWYSQRERSILEFMLSYADIVDWFEEFLFGCMNECINFKQTEKNQKDYHCNSLILRLWDLSISWFQMGLSPSPF